MNVETAAKDNPTERRAKVDLFLIRSAHSLPGAFGLHPLVPSACPLS